VWAARVVLVWAARLVLVWAARVVLVWAARLVLVWAARLVLVWAARVVLVWAARYHSHSHETADTFAGLMGAIIISRRGSSRPDGTLLDVDRCVIYHPCTLAPLCFVLTEQSVNLPACLIITYSRCLVIFSNRNLRDIKVS
jgi:hypothetical protein